MLRTALCSVALATLCADLTAAQRLSVDAGLLIGQFPSEVVYELHGDSPPFHATRASFTLSWTNDSYKPAVLTEAERTIIDTKAISTGVGAGLLWLEAADYHPYPMIISTTFVPVPLPRTGIVAIALTQPFQNFDWSVTVALSVGLYSGR